MKQHPLKIVMIGPDDTVLGGMTSVQQTLRKHWHQDDYPMRYLGVYCHGSKFKKLWVAMRSLCMFVLWLIVWRPQIVHVHFSYKAGFYRESFFMLVSRAFGCSTFAHAHAPDFDGFYQQQWPIAQGYIRFVLNHMTKLIVLSATEEMYYQSIASSVPIVTLYNPVEIPAVSSPAEAKPIILTLGQLGQRKGTYDLLEAIPQVVEQLPDVEFWLGGDGDVEAIEQITNEENMTQHVKLLGWVTGDDKHEALRSALIYVLPAYHEALPVSVIEAMMYGVPVITTTVGGIPDVFVHDNHALLIEAGDVSALVAALLMLLTDEDKRHMLTQNAHALVMQSFTPEVILRQLEAIYNAHG